MRSLFNLGGYFASGILIVLEAGTVVVGALGFSEVRDTIAQEDITATHDAREQGADLDPGQVIDTGAEAKEFAKIIRANVLEISGDRTYPEMGRFLTPSGRRPTTGSWC